MGRRLALLAVAAAALFNLTQAFPDSPNATINPKLGLLASSLGVPPVPGASYGGGDDSGTAYSGGEGTSYSVGKGDYGPPVGPQVQPVPAPLQSCKCVPAKFCANPVKPGGGVPPYGGGNNGGVVGGNGNYGGNGGVVGGNGGNYGPGPGPAVGGTGGNYGPGPAVGTGGGNYGPGQVGGNGGDYGQGQVGGNGGDYGQGQVGGNGGNYGPGQVGGNGGNYGPGPAGGNGGNYGPEPVEPSYPGTGGNHGGNGGAVGGGHGGVVGGGHGGNYGGEDGLGTDGAGLIDIRIVNRPPGGPVVCLNGEVYCCDQGGQGPYPPPGPEPYPPPSPVQNGQCGVRQIIPVPGQALEYGQAQFGAYPWMAVMLGPNNNYLGAGALIDSYHVLTAAHKIYDYKGQFKVRFGEWNAAADDEPYKNVEVDAGRIEIHPAFNPKNLQNDVAIITLAQPVNLNSYPHIKSACLPQQGSQFVGQRCYVAGFGKDAFQTGKHSYILRDVDVPVVESNDCEQRLRGTRLGSYFNLNRKSFLCAGGEEGKDACTGDGGSPLVCEYNGHFTVVGLVAWGIGCADYGIPGVYVNVPNYVGWIESQLYSTPTSTGGDDLGGYARIKPAAPKN